MRLIDADALLEDVRKHSESYFADDFAEYWVDRQPTVAPAAQPQDVVDKNKLVETIKHYMQYPDGLSRLLTIYGGD